MMRMETAAGPRIAEASVGAIGPSSTCIRVPLNQAGLLIEETLTCSSLPRCSPPPGEPVAARRTPRYSAEPKLDGQRAQFQIRDRRTSTPSAARPRSDPVPGSRAATRDPVARQLGRARRRGRGGQRGHPGRARGGPPAGGPGPSLRSTSSRSTATASCASHGQPGASGSRIFSRSVAGRVPRARAGRLAGSGTPGLVRVATASC
jgi:hypothetical protein